MNFASKSRETSPVALRIHPESLRGSISMRSPGGSGRPAAKEAPISKPFRSRRGVKLIAPPEASIRVDRSRTDPPVRSTRPP